MNDSRGSLWRRWDLHVHTPASVLNNQFGDDWDTYVHGLLSAAVAKKIAVVGITDYYSVEGYRRLKADYLTRPDVLGRIFASELAVDPDYLDKIRHITFMANIEFRLNVVIEKGGDKKLNLHVLFAEDATAKQIEDNFLTQLRFTFEGIPQGQDDARPLNIENLEELGRRRKAQFPKLEGTDLYQGCIAAAIDDEEISRVLASNGLFRNRYAVILAEELTSDLPWLSQSGHLRGVLVQKSDAIFSANDKTRAWALDDAFMERFGARKPCLWGSDAHFPERLFEPHQQRYCWIKADPNFAGLRQVMNEPEARAFIGPVPPLLDEIAQQRRFFIETIDIRKKASSGLKEPWFDGASLRLNPEMVAIIGNKGSGKSALADTVALVGGCQLGEDEYGFLKAKRFRARDAGGKVDRSAEFEAGVTWSNGEVSPFRSLSASVSPGEVERVKYLPQGYLERICNERDVKSVSDFQQELDRVIFSHVSVADRLGRSTLAELLDDETAESKRSRSALKVRLRELNLRIVGVEERLSPETQSRIEQRIASRTKELEALARAEPSPVASPAEDETTRATTATVMTELDQLNQSHVELQQELKTATRMLTDVRQSAADARKLRQRVEGFQTQFAAMVAELKSVAESLGLSIENVVRLEVDLAGVSAIMQEKESEAERLKGMTDAFDPDSLPARMKKLEQVAAEKRAELDVPNQQYQAYVKEHAEWEHRRQELLGAVDQPESLLWLQDQLRLLADRLPDELADLKRNRRALVDEIFNEIAREALTYRRYYEPAQRAIEAHRVLDAEFDIRFLVTVTCRNIADEFFSLVAQNKTGSFYGADEGRRRLRDIVAAAEFETIEGMRSFLDSMEEALTVDLRDRSRPSIPLSRQMKKEKSSKALYDFLYSLDYLEPRYELRLGERTLQELSPGERGLMLLVFYLAIDDDRMPLIIDQPEENLDNNSVKRYLVPCIRHAKKRRQLFVVTHNPNLAVVCDAEQVIHAKIDKSAGNRVQYDAGSIEHSPTNLNLLNVLEGTKVAFESRRAKYRAGGSL
jgi:ABC-type lipoprotein export system ATPase subunit/enamine deaminase RidA (YjgF/YER057c/UK114 family)